MWGLSIGGIHTYESLGMMLQKKELAAAPIKENKLEIMGGHGSLDQTEYFGEPKYGEPSHKFTFSILGPDVVGQYNRIKNALHGLKGRIILDDDPARYYVGRCHVSTLTTQQGTGIVTLECTCEPWRYKIAETVITAQVDGSQTVILTNGKRRAVPSVAIETDGTLHVLYEQSTWSLGAGVYTLPELELKQGRNTVTVAGTGKITFTWREGDL